ncbi:MAG: ligase-associated DNA damage response DEXH box helicase [Flammeovirgaceae bacterium]
MHTIINTSPQSIIQDWFQSKNWTAFPFQQDCWNAYLEGKSGILNAPTGSGKTYALWLACLMEYMQANPDYKVPKAKKNGLQILWITPLRALTKDIARAMQEACETLEIPWQVQTRTGDTSSKERERQKKHMPECLITTPESLHVLLAQKNYPRLFKTLKAIVIDEWHELVGSKRGVQVELGLSRLKALKPDLKVWGISATIGNLQQAANVLIPSGEATFVKADIRKKISVSSILPDRVEYFPWAGHLGINLIAKVIPIIRQSTTTLLFTNTRAQTEIWYQKILEQAPEFAGTMAMHHGSLDRNVRDWVEDALHQGILKLVVCTSSLDLGVDFRPVETVIQVGSPKGVARFLQRAGRSGHRPDALSQIYFLPTHSLELLEGAALRQATEEVSLQGDITHLESRLPVRRAFDVLVQYLVTLAVSDGFDSKELFQELKNTYGYRELSEQEWDWCLAYITTGGNSLGAYDEYNKVEKEGDFYKVTSRKVAMRHRLSMGTIVSEPIIKIRYKRGAYIGSVEEYFIARLKQGDVFHFAGRNLEFLELKGMTASVKDTNKKSNQIPRWLGGRLPLSSELSALIQKKLEGAEFTNDVEVNKIKPILDLQRKWSCIPKRGELLIETTQSEHGYHAFFYPFQGRLVHEVMAALIAYRIGQLEPITFSMAMNDYGFELLSDVKIPLEYALSLDLFTTENLDSDIQDSMNKTEMARRKFRDIATISGLIFPGYPGKSKRSSHLQASSALLFGVFEEYDPDNLLIKQSFDEVLAVQLEHPRLVNTLKTIQKQKIVIKATPHPTPFAFPILVDGLRDKLSTESLGDRIAKMVVEFSQDG